jgi:hypothetical protein
MSTPADWHTPDDGDATPDESPRTLFPTDKHDHDAKHGHDYSGVLGGARHMLAHAMEPGIVRTATIAAFAAGTGVAVGFWLGGRIEARRSRSVVENVDVPDLVKLAPVAAKLMANPVVRIYAARIAARQVRRFLERAIPAA